jgi:hypothetical protein
MASIFVPCVEDNRNQWRFSVSSVRPLAIFHLSAYAALLLREGTHVNLPGDGSGYQGGAALLKQIDSVLGFGG